VGGLTARNSNIRYTDVNRFLNEFKNHLKSGRKPPLDILKYLGMTPVAPEGAVFNPMQVKAIKVGLMSDSPFIVESPTASGKSLVMYMAIAYALSHFRSCIITAPMKALVEEKYSELKETLPWAQVERLTSDYDMNNRKITSLSTANIVITTPESLASRATKYTSTASTFLRRARLLVVDEAHFIGSSGRGVTIEVGIIQAIRANPDLRPIFMSATIGNAEDLRRWLNTLTGQHCHKDEKSRRIILIQSTYRPTKLKIHLVRLPKAFASDKVRIQAVQRIIDSDLQGEFLIFCPTRRQTVEVARSLAGKYGRRNVAYHNASLNREKRAEIERKFREGEIRILTANSTVAVGVNLPAKHVIVYSVH